MQPSVIDADVHLAVPRIEALYPYLPNYWIEHIENTLFKGPVQQYHPPHSQIAARLTADGMAPAASVERLKHQLLDAPEAIGVKQTREGAANCLRPAQGVRIPSCTERARVTTTPRK